VSQLSFFSAESVPPAVADLTGILAASGQVVLVGSGAQQAARLSVVVDRLWRAEGLAEMIADTGLIPEIGRTDENTPLVRTAVDRRLIAMGRGLDRGAVEDRPAALVARAEGTEGLDVGRGHAGGGRPLPARARPHAPDTQLPSHRQ